LRTRIFGCKLAQTSLKLFDVSRVRQIGIALQLYTDDFNDTMALVRDWASLGGKTGRYDLLVNETNKPLYRYQGTPEIFRCPADRGDRSGMTFVGINCTNCYAQYGTSYLIEFAVDFMRTKRVFGNVAAPRNGYDGQSMKTSEIAISPAGGCGVPIAYSQQPSSD
jgi:hypothetical protein